MASLNTDSDVNRMRKVRKKMNATLAIVVMRWDVSLCELSSAHAEIYQAALIGNCSKAWRTA